MGGGDLFYDSVVRGTAHVHLQKAMGDDTNSTCRGSRAREVTREEWNQEPQSSRLDPREHERRHEHTCPPPFICSICFSSAAPADH
ncbi:hypothetical protein DNTS_003331 [Danionella cerebrum]|uniref:Uncharacterized protein n=1 Tax=Danionella cerebrum TaxID=2873325 RepID=A0A553QNV9_9TELE|nr:hypothetical protein DNTS_003331 [Danionella translucida]